MATKVYAEHEIMLIDGTKITVFPLKIKHLHKLMETFEVIKTTEEDFEAIGILTECVRIAMKQFYPQISESIEDIENSFDLPTIYKILDYVAGIKLGKQDEEPVKDQAKESGSTWSDLDLLKLESEVFLLGMWKNYDDLETSLSMPELLQIISMKRELDHLEKKFLAAMQGVDIDKGVENDKWQEMKQRILYNNKDSKDAASLTGKRAQEVGFGVGMGLDYEVITD